MSISMLLGDLARLPSKEGRYRCDANEGDTSLVYIFDSGFDVSHDEFEGRLTFAEDFTKPPKKDILTQSGEHGTHVASIILGKTFGVAKKATGIGVKVFREPEDRTDRNWDSIVKGIEWGIKDAKQKIEDEEGDNAIFNLSLGWAYERGYKIDCSEMKKVVEKAIKEGIVVVIGAGNDNLPTDAFCPSGIEKAITVGAIDQSFRRSDWPATSYDQIRFEEERHINVSGSNHGLFVDIWAPGTNIMGAISGPGNKSEEWNGTSMATPYVAGTLAVLMASEKERKTPEEWKEKLIELSIKDELDAFSLAGGPNRLLYNGVYDSGVKRERKETDDCEENKHNEKRDKKDEESKPEPKPKPKPKPSQRPYLGRNRRPQMPPRKWEPGQHSDSNRGFNQIGRGRDPHKKCRIPDPKGNGERIWGPCPDEEQTKSYASR